MRYLAVSFLILLLVAGCRHEDDDKKRVEDAQNALQRMPANPLVQQGLELLRSGARLEKPVLLEARFSPVFQRDWPYYAERCTLWWLEQDATVRGVVIEDSAGNRHEWPIFAKPPRNTDSVLHRYNVLLVIGEAGLAAAKEARAEEANGFAYITRQMLVEKLRLALLLEDGQTSNFVDVDMCPYLLDVYGVSELLPTPSPTPGAV